MKRTLLSLLPLIMSTALVEADSWLFFSVCKTLAEKPSSFSEIFEKLIPVALSNQLPFTTPANLLRILITIISPVSISPEQIATVADELFLSNHGQAHLEEADLIEDVEDLLMWITRESPVNNELSLQAILQIVKDLTAFLDLKAKSFGFVGAFGSATTQELLFSFIKAKTLQLSSFHHDLSELNPLFALLNDSSQFTKWLNGLILPYIYYWRNYASLGDFKCSTSDFLSKFSSDDQFFQLIEPLDSQEDVTYSETMDISLYLNNVILPFLAYNGDNLDPLSSWMSAKTTNLTQHLQLWDRVLRSVVSFAKKEESFSSHACMNFVRAYVISCVKETIAQEAGLSPSKLSQAYSQISLTANYLVTTLNIENVSPLNIATTLEASAKVATENNSSNIGLENQILMLVKAPVTQSLITLQSIARTCDALYPMNGLTMGKYFQLKSTSTVDYDMRQQEILKILSRVSELNYKQVLGSIDLFVSTFVGTDVSLIRDIDQLIIECLFNGNLFSLVLKYYQSKNEEFKISSNDIFDLGVKKFWDLVLTASNIDERIGKMKLAAECLNVLTVLSSEKDIQEDKRYTTMRLKHFVKALGQLKNFKLVLDKNLPITPQQILNRLNHLDDDEPLSPVSLVSSVLEQNPKSYLAYEKLYKIVVDLALFLEIEDTDSFLPKVQSACIESSLIDDNFAFAYKQSKELFNFYVTRGQSEQLGRFWLTFYQVGKYILTEWFNEYDEKISAEKIEILLKQREILSSTLKLMKPSSLTVDNSRLIIGQLRHVNREIHRWYTEDSARYTETTQRAVESTRNQIQSNIKNLVGDASLSRAQAGEKLSNLLVSGIGWAIGANRQEP